MLRPPVDQAAEAARLYALAAIYAALGALAWIATGRRLARTGKEI